ncbi:MAG: sigma-70 family RNA polymerase sigma factor [Actinomycetota bacterium]
MGVDRAADAVAEALTYAWEHWERISTLENPVGYLYRVARSASRIRTPKRVRWIVRHDASMPDIEPELIRAVGALPPRQRTAVWLVHACGWTHGEVADALDISPSAVSTHVARALIALRRRLGAEGGGSHD